MASLPIVYVMCAQGGSLCRGVEQVISVLPARQLKYEFRFVGEEEFPEALKQLQDGVVVPYAVIFDGLQIALEHPLIGELRNFPEVLKLLVMGDQHDPDLITLTVNWCGLHGALVTPLDWTQLQSGLERGQTTLKISRRLFDAQKELSRLRTQERMRSSQMAAVAAANSRAVELMATLETKNRVIEEKNRFLERLGRTLLQRGKEGAPEQDLAPCEPCASSAVFIEGTLTELSLLDLVQLLGMCKKTATIALEGAAGNARMVFLEGQIVDAEASGLRGEPAVSALLDWQDGSFAIHAVSEEIKPVIKRRTEDLLIDLLRQKDERA